MLQSDPRVAISPTPRSYVATWVLWAIPPLRWQMSPSPLVGAAPVLTCSKEHTSAVVVLTAGDNFQGNKRGENFSRFYIDSMILILPSSLQFSLESLILTTLDAALGEWNLNYNVWSHMICATDPPQSVGLTFMTPVLWLCMDAFWFNIIIYPMAQMPDMYFWVAYDRRWSGSVKSRPLSSLLPA